MFTPYAPYSVDLNILAFMKHDKYWDFNTYCTTYENTGNPHTLIITGPGVHEEYVYPNDSFSDGRRVFRNSVTNEISYGNTAARNFIFYPTPL